MVNKRTVAMLIGLGCVLLTAGRNFAQDSPEVKYLAKPTAKDILDGLAIDKGVAPHLKPLKPQCQEFSQDVKGATPETTIAFPVLFAFNSDKLSPEMERTLDEVGQALNNPSLRPYCIRLEGHTDSVGSDTYNQGLSERRAKSVMQYLVTHQHVDEKRLFAVGYGKTHPFTTNDTKEGQQKNRRVQVANLGSGPTAKSQSNQ